MNNEQSKKLEFMAVILDLKEAYINFDFELMDENNNFTRRLELWYGVLGHIDLQTLSYVVLDYIKTSIYPPQSPAHLLEHYKKIYLQLKQPSDEAFDNCIEVWRRKRHNFEKTLRALEGKGLRVEAKAFGLIRGQLYQSNGVSANTTDIQKWGRKEFKEHFETYSNIYANEEIRSNTSVLKIENNVPKLVNERRLIE